MASVVVVGVVAVLSVVVCAVVVAVFVFVSMSETYPYYCESGNYGR